MTSCSQLMDIEELVLGELEAEAAASLRQHARECAECRAELAMITAERALFASRAEVVADPPAEIVLAARDRIAAEREVRPVRAASRAVSGVVHLLRRGHVTAACAAALFAVAGMSRLGGGANIVIASSPQVAPITADSAEASGDQSQMARALSKRGDEALACEVTTVKPLATFSKSLRDELGVGSKGAYSAYSASLASLDSPLACGGEETRDHGVSGCERASCDPGVTCSSWRQ